MYYKMTLPLICENTSDEKAAVLLAHVETKLGFIPNMYAAMANMPALLETYLFAYERFHQDSSFNDIEQEIILLSISYVNGCDYCMAAHSTLADNYSHVPPDITNAIRSGSQIPDTKLQTLVTLTQSLVIDRGWSSEEDVHAFLEQGYTEKHILDILLAIGIKTMSNYTNHLFSTPLDEQFKGRAWKK